MVGEAPAIQCPWISGYIEPSLMVPCPQGLACVAINHTDVHQTVRLCHCWTCQGQKGQAQGSVPPQACFESHMSLRECAYEAVRSRISNGVKKSAMLRSNLNP